MRSFARTWCVAALSLYAVTAAPADKEPSRRSKATRIPALYYLDHYDVSAPLRDMPVIAPQDERGEQRGIGRLPVRRGRAEILVPQGASAPSPRLSAAPGLSFLGLGKGFRGFTVTSAPPDTNGAVGRTQYVQWVNTSFAVFDKATGAKIYGPAAGNTLWQGFGGACQSKNSGDPIAQYDKAADRWMMTQFALDFASGHFFQCVAVSTSGNATGTYRRFSYQFVDLNDYPKVGVWPDGYYLSFNMFAAGSFNFLGSKVCALDRNTMVATSGTPGPIVCFDTGSSYGGLLPSDLDGAAPPPPGSPNYFVALSFFSNALQIWKFHVDWASPVNSTFTGPTDLPVAPFTPACFGGTCIPQRATSTLLDSLADRLMYRLAYRNMCDHESLLVNHSVDTGATGSSGVRWYELRDPGGAPTVFQQGTFAPDSLPRWMGSIAMDHAGNMLLGYSVSSNGLYPAIRVTGRETGDPLGAMRAEDLVLNPGASQTKGLSRWGDYSAMTVDPVDDCTFWYTTEYVWSSGAFTWATWVASFKFPSCPGPDFAVAAPVTAILPQEDSIDKTITVSSSGGFSAPTDLAVSGLPNGVTAQFSQTPVTPPADGQITSTLTLTAAATATLGNSTITVTATSGCVTKSTTFTLSVVVPPPVVVLSDGAEGGTTLSFSNTTSGLLWSAGPFAFRGNRDWHGGSPTFVGYGPGEARMTTAGLDLTGATQMAQLSYAYRLSLDNTADFLEVRLSTDGGTSWTRLARQRGHSPSWPAWTPAAFDLTPYLGLNGVLVQFRLVAGGNGAATSGADIDELRVVKSRH